MCIRDSPSSAPGQKPTAMVTKTPTAMLKPVTKLTPIESSSMDLDADSSEDAE